MAFGFDHAALLRHNTLFIVRSMTIEYFKPARLHDSLQTTIEVVNSGRCYIVFAQRVMRGGEVLTSAAVKVAVVAKGTASGRGDLFKPVAMPGILRRKLENS